MFTRDFSVDTLDTVDILTSILHLASVTSMVSLDSLELYREVSLAKFVKTLLVDYLELCQTFTHPVYIRQSCLLRTGIYL